MAEVATGDGALSTFALTDLALHAAIELDRMRLGLDHDPAVLGKLAAALRRTSIPPGDAPPFRFVEPGYYLPLERLDRTQESRQPHALEEIQNFIERTSDALSHANSADQADLISFCIALHQALIQDSTAEDGFAVYDWRALGDNTALGVRAA